ncbi:MAG TPA: hypothetical protein VK428_06235 [Acidimicrobiales bacterium]|nr:hypothetical protein [Acidimicrobiales bacterium]
MTAGGHSDPRPESKGPPLSVIGQKYGIATRILDDRIQETEVFGALIAEQQRVGFSHSTEDPRRSTPKGLSNRFAQARFAPKYSFMNGPLKSIATHSLVSVETGEFC